MAIEIPAEQSLSVRLGTFPSSHFAFWRIRPDGWSSLLSRWPIPPWPRLQFFGLNRLPCWLLGRWSSSGRRPLPPTFSDDEPSPRVRCLHHWPELPHWQNYHNKIRTENVVYKKTGKREAGSGKLKPIANLVHLVLLARIDWNFTCKKEKRNRGEKLKKQTHSTN